MPPRGRTSKILVQHVETNGAASPETLAEMIRRRISDAFGLYVDEVLSVPSGTIGRTTSGKVQRAAVKAQYERGAFNDR